MSPGNARVKPAISTREPRRVIAVSLMMSSILRLRLINMAGALAFAVYGVLIRSYPVAALNSFTVAVNAFYLARMLRAKVYFQILKLRPDSDYLRYFLGFYRKEILRILPDFEYRPAPRKSLMASCA